MSAALDTLSLARNLHDKAQFSPEQAEGVADALAEAMQGDLATMAGLESEAQGVRGESRETGLRLMAEIEATEADLIEWVVGMVGFQTLVLLGAALAPARAVAH